MKLVTYKTVSLLFLFVCIIFFQQTIRFGKLPVPTDTLMGLYHPWRDAVSQEYPRGMPYKNFLITDPIRQQIPWKKEAIERIKQGELPLLSTYNAMDVPLLGNIQAGTLYPFNLVFFIMSFESGWTVLIISQVVLAGLLFLLYASRLNLHPAAAFIGATAWSFCGFSIAWLTWGTIIHTVLWLPLLLFTIDTWREERSAISLVLCSIGLSCSFFAGHAQAFFYIFLLTCAYVLFRFFKPANETSEKSGLGYLVGIILSILLFIIITSIQWYPLYHALEQSNRIGEEMLIKKEGWFIPFQHLVQLVAPDFFGNPATLNYWGTWNYGEMVSYIGLIPLLFIIPAVLFTLRKNSFWLLVAVVVCLFMTPTSIAYLPYEWNIPVLSTLQPTRLTVLFQFAFIMLSVSGVDYLLQKKLTLLQFISVTLLSLLPITLIWLSYVASKQQMISFIPLEYLDITGRNIVLPTVLSGIFISIVFITQIKRIVILAISVLIVITSFELLRFGWKFTPFTDKAYFFPETETIQFFRNQDLQKRVMAVDTKILPPNTNAYYSIPLVSHYDPLSSERYETFIAAMERGKPDISKPYGFNRIVTPQSISSPLFPHLSVGYLVSLSSLDGLSLIHQEAETKVYQAKNTLPFIYLVSDVVFATNTQESISALYDSNFIPGTQAVIESETIEFNKRVTGILRVLEHSAERIRVEVTTGGNMVLVVNRLYDPWWRVTINGHPSRIVVTNGAFMGVVVPSGTHTLEFSYGIRL